MKEPISSYEDYCRVWAEVYKKHARSAWRSLYSCYVREGILRAVKNGEYPRPSRDICTAEDDVGLYIVRALLAQGMTERAVIQHTDRMQEYVDDAESRDLDAIDCMASGVEGLSEASIPQHGNRVRYLWALAGGFDLVEAARDSGLYNPDEEYDD